MSNDFNLIRHKLRNETKYAIFFSQLPLQALVYNCQLIIKLISNKLYIYSKQIDCHGFR